MSLEVNTILSSVNKSRRQRPKIEKSAEEFKEHERLLMNKRNQEVNNAVTKKCHVIWNQFLHNKPKPNPLQFNFMYHNIDKYLNVCDSYQPSQHKDPKQKWWNNQKASEMSQEFLPSILNATDQMAEYLGNQISNVLRADFTNYCIFELLETAITAVFSTMRSGSNEVFLRTSFQYSKANLRKKLVSYFSEEELRPYDLTQRKKKDLWYKLIKQKKDALSHAFSTKRSMLYTEAKHALKMDINDTDYNAILPPSIHSISDSMSCSTSNNSVNTNTVPPINWNECIYPSANTNEYQPFRTVSLSSPYHVNDYKTEDLNMRFSGYGHHRQCTDCLNYMNKMSELLSINNKLQQESNQLKQLNHEYVTDRQKWRAKYQSLLLQVQSSSNQWMDNENMNNMNNMGNMTQLDMMHSLDNSNGSW